jgi:precorrin-2/cobalt-factor-2 C20-methyltransferase
MGGTEAMSGTVFGLGVGPGDPELITLKAQRILARVPVVAYPATESGDSLARAIAAPHLPPGVAEVPIVIPIYASSFPDDGLYDAAAERLARRLAAGDDVAVLCEGDPFFYGSFMYLFARLAERFPVEVVPGVSSLTACAAALGMPLAARDDVLTVLPATLDETTLRQRLEATDAAALIKVGRHLPKVRRVLAALGLESRARYVERVTMAAERRLPLAEAPAEAPYFSMILVHRRGEAWR